MTTYHPVRAEEDKYSFRDAGFTGGTSCSDFFKYIGEHPNVTPSTNAQNAVFVLMLIITSQKASKSDHMHGDQMTPARMQRYENSFANNCEHDLKMPIADAMKNAVQEVDKNDPV